MPSGIITISAVPVSNPAPNSVISRILADGTVGLLLPLPPFPSLAPMHMGKYLWCVDCIDRKWMVCCEDQHRACSDNYATKTAPSSSLSDVFLLETVRQLLGVEPVLSLYLR